MACDIHGANQRAPTKSMCHPAEKVEEPLMQQRLCLSGLRGAGSDPADIRVRWLGRVHPGWVIRVLTHENHSRLHSHQLDMIMTKIK